jgi:hypothetical protein
MILVPFLIVIPLAMTHPTINGNFSKMCCCFGSSQGEPQWHIFSQGILQQTLAMKMSLLPRDKTKASWGQSSRAFVSLYFETGHSKLTCLKL